MGAREKIHRTDQLIFTSANYVQRQFIASWLVGVFLSVGIGCGVAINLAINGAFIGILAWIVGALFIPSMALFLGVWTGSNKLFEFAYTMLWYIGPMNGVAALDYMGSIPESTESGIWIFYLILTAFLLGLSVVRRKFQMQQD